MDWIWVVAIVFAAFVIFSMMTRGSREQKPLRRYRQRGSLFTAAERSFLGVLDQATEGRYRVFGKVRVADVLATAKGLDNSARTTAFNQISAKHFDFVLCDSKTLDIKAAIELNDKSHNSNRRAARDEFLRSACAEASLRLFEVPAQRSYTVEAVRQLIVELEGELRADVELALSPPSSD